MVRGNKGEVYGYPPMAVNAETDPDGNGVVCERVVSDVAELAILPSIELTGTGDSLITYELTAGKKIFDLTHTGEGVFIVLIEDLANSKDLVLTHVGPYEGQQLVLVGVGFSELNAGPFSIAVKADGDWTIIGYEVPEETNGGARNGQN